MVGIPRSVRIGPDVGEGKKGIEDDKETYLAHRRKWGSHLKNDFILLKHNTQVGSRKKYHHFLRLGKPDFFFDLRISPKT